MHRRIGTIVLIALAASSGHAGAQMPLTLEALLDSNAAALGARAHLDGLHSIVTLRTRTSLFSVKVPHFVLVESFDATGRLEYAEGYDGQAAWEQTGRDSARRVVTGRPEIALRRVAQWPGNVAPLYRVPEFGLTLTLEGMDTVESRPHYRVRVTLPDGFQRWYFVDAKTYLLTRARDTRELHANDGQTRVIETVFEDYRRVNGLLFPFYVGERDLNTGERLSGRTMLAIFPNASAADTLFGVQGRSEYARVRAAQQLVERSAGQVGPTRNGGLHLHWKSPRTPRHPPRRHAASGPG